MRLAHLGTRRGFRLSRRPGMPASALILVAYALLHHLVFGCSVTVLDLARFRTFWTGSTWLGISLLDASVAVTVLLALLIAAEELQAWSRRERVVIPSLVAYVVTLLLLHGLSVYLQSVSRVAERMAW
jgi:hypothetical protein